MSRSFVTVWRLMVVLNEGLILTWIPCECCDTAPTIPFQNFFRRTGPLKWQSGPIVSSCLVRGFAWKTIWNISLTCFTPIFGMSVWQDTIFNCSPFLQNDQSRSHFVIAYLVHEATSNVLSIWCMNQTH